MRRFPYDLIVRSYIYLGRFKFLFHICLNFFSQYHLEEANKTTATQTSSTIASSAAADSPAVNPTTTTAADSATTTTAADSAARPTTTSADATAKQSASAKTQHQQSARAVPSTEATDAAGVYGDESFTVISWWNCHRAAATAAAHGAVCRTAASIHDSNDSSIGAVDPARAGETEEGQGEAGSRTRRE